MKLLKVELMKETAPIFFSEEITFTRNDFSIYIFKEIAIMRQMKILMPQTIENININFK